jgi:hypothetical protein
MGLSIGNLLAIAWWLALLRYVAALVVVVLADREGTFGSRLRETATTAFWVLVAYVVFWFVAVFAVGLALNVVPRSWVVVALWLAIIGTIISWFAFAVELILAGIAGEREA